MQLSDCHNVEDFRRLAKACLPKPIFNYIDGAADDERTKDRNTSAFDDCDLVPNVLAGVSEIEMGVTVMGKPIAMPLMLSPTALQRLFHWQGERAVAATAQKFGTWFGISSLATVSIEEIGETIESPKMFQLYIHKDKGLNRSMIERCKAAKFDAIALTVDTIVSGNRERCLRSGFTSPPRFTPASVLSYAIHPMWALNYMFREKFALPNLQTHVDAGSNVAVWGGEFCLKGIMSVEDAKRAVDIGATAIMVSNHGGRQLDGSRAPFDQISEIADAVGGKIDIICDGGVRRGSHVLKAIAAGATACSGGRLYLYALAAAGEAGVQRVVGKLRDEIERDMKLMGVRSVPELDASKLRWR
jgi:L-lactate dehydrogenase (cytochrome)